MGRTGKVDNQRCQALRGSSWQYKENGIASESMGLADGNSQTALMVRHRAPGQKDMTTLHFGQHHQKGGSQKEVDTAGQL